MNKPLPPLWFRLAFFVMVSVIVSVSLSLPLAALFWSAGTVLDLYHKTRLTVPLFTLWGWLGMACWLGLLPYCLKRAFEQEN